MSKLIKALSMASLMMLGTTSLMAQTSGSGTGTGGTSSGSGTSGTGVGSERPTDPNMSKEQQTLPKKLEREGKFGTGESGGSSK